LTGGAGAGGFGIGGTGSQLIFTMLGSSIGGTGVGVPGAYTGILVNSGGTMQVAFSGLATGPGTATIYVNGSPAGSIPITTIAPLGFTGSVPITVPPGGGTITINSTSVITGASLTVTGSGNAFPFVGQYPTASPYIFPSNCSPYGGGIRPLYPYSYYQSYQC
jgi:hypothetical protein